jgi:hypothetical protein
MPRVKLFAAIFTGLVFAAGCGSSEDPSPSGPAQRIVRSGMAAPLSGEEIQAFLDVATALPGGKAPEFRAPPFEEAPENSTGRELANCWKREFQVAYSPSTQARLWKEDDQLTAALDDLGVEPKALASLLVRLSSAVVRDALSDRVDLAQLRHETERRIVTLCRPRSSRIR